MTALNSPAHSVIPAKAGISVCQPTSQQREYGPGVARLFVRSVHERSVNRDSRFRGNDPVGMRNFGAIG